MQASVRSYYAISPSVRYSSHSTKFSNTLKIILKDPEKREIIQKQYAFDPGDIGVHSWRKAAHTKMSCGSTAGPTNSAACIRGGHSIGA